MPSRRMRRPLVVIVLITALTMISCTAGPGAPPAPRPASSSAADPGSPPAAPRSDFPALPGRTETGAYDWIEDLASRGSEVVAVGFVYAGSAIATFRHSRDGGATWVQGELDARSQAQVPVGADEYADDVVAGRGGWLAAGRGSGRQMLVWRSPDGKTWTRHPVDRRVMNDDTDEIGELVATPTGFLAVGSRRRADDEMRPVAWVSRDGLRWTARWMGGTGSANAVAGRGRTHVAVGRDGQETDQRAWRSTDGGATWTRVGVPRPPEDGDHNRGLADVAATGLGFVAIGHVYRRDYQPTLFRSSDGRRWSYDRSVASLASAANSHGDGVVSDGPRVLAITWEDREFDAPVLWTQQGRRWRRATSPLEGELKRAGRASWVIRAKINIPNGWLVAAMRNDALGTDTQLWRSTDGGATFAKVELKSARENKPLVNPFDLVSVDGRTLVVGNSQGLSVRWTRTDTGAVLPPATLSTSPLESVSGGAAGGDGSFLAWASRSAQRGDAIVWAGDSSGSVGRSAPYTFGKNERYAASEIRSARWLAGRWWVVGEKTGNADVNRSALVYSSTDGQTWTEGRPAQVYQKENDVVWNEITDLQGDHEVVRSMNDITQTRRGLLAVGYTEQDQLGRPRAAIWRSRDTRRWALASLPHPGFDAGSADTVLNRGDVVVIAGSVRRRGSERAVPYVWTSSDAGGTWRGRPVAAQGAQPSLTRLVTTASTFVLTGSTGDEPSKPLSWTSPDGLRWTPLTWTAFPVRPGDEVTVLDLEGDGDDLIGLTKTTSRIGTGTVLFRQRIG